MAGRFFLLAATPFRVSCGGVTRSAGRDSLYGGSALSAGQDSF